MYSPQNLLKSASLGIFLATMVSGCYIVTNPPPKKAPPRPAATQPTNQPAPAKTASTKKPKAPAGISKPAAKPAGTSNTPQPMGPISHPKAVEAEMYDAINSRRTRGATCGGQAMAPTNALAPQPQLTQAALAHTNDMVTNNVFDQVGSDKSTPETRAKAAGYNGSVDENIGAGSNAVQEIVDAWMNSPEHCSIIMDPANRTIGISYAHRTGTEFEHYWSTMFGE